MEVEKIDGFVKIAGAFLGIDRDTGTSTDVEFYEDQDRRIYFRYVWSTYQERAESKIQISKLRSYHGIMTRLEIIEHPDWANSFEEIAVRLRPCKKDLEKIAETLPKRFKAYRGPAVDKTEYFECRCCNQLYLRNIWTLEESGEVLIDSGFEPEIHLSKKQIIKYAGKISVLNRIRRRDILEFIKKNRPH